jgi:hypothetical protein
MMRNRKRRRNSKLGRAKEPTLWPDGNFVRLENFISREPTCEFEFFGIEFDRIIGGVGDAADHEFACEWPRLRRYVIDFTNLNACLLKHLSPNEQQNGKKTKKRKKKQEK